MSEWVGQSRSCRAASAAVLTRHTPKKRKEGNVLGALTIIAPVFGVLALLFAFYLIGKVKRQDAGTDRMQIGRAHV